MPQQAKKIKYMLMMAILKGHPMLILLVQKHFKVYKEPRLQCPKKQKIKKICIDSTTTRVRFGVQSTIIITLLVVYC